MQTDERADPEKFHDGFAANPDFPIPHQRHPEERTEGGKDTAPCDQHRCADGAESAKNRRRGKDDHKQVELEEWAADNGRWTGKTTIAKLRTFLRVGR